MSDSEVWGEPSANRSNCIPPSTPPLVAGIERIEIGDDGDSGPELPPSVMPAATLEMEEAGSYSEKMASASNFKGEIIDDDEDAIGENVDIIDPIDVDDDKLAGMKRKSEDSGCNPKRRTTESSTQDETIDDSTRAYVCGITDVPSGRTDNDCCRQPHTNAPRCVSCSWDVSRRRSRYRC